MILFQPRPEDLEVLISFKIILDLDSFAEVALKNSKLSLYHLKLLAKNSSKLNIN